LARVTISICEKCGESFTINLDECQLLPGMYPRVRKQDEEARPIRTWVDWIDHISNNCPQCRYPQPPIHAIEDLERFNKKRRS
jgi:hypothetical protein